MSDPESSRPLEPLPSDDLLVRLMGDIQRTRGVVRGLLDTRRPGTGVQVLEAREQAKAALERFVAVLVERRLPIPRQINDELQLMRRLCGHTWVPYRGRPR